VSFRHTPHSSGSPEEDLLLRLTAYSKYVALVQAQEEALEEGDLERHAQLAEEREEIQEELGEAPSSEELAVASEDPEARALMERTLSSLRSALAKDAGMQRTLQGLKDEASGQIRSMGSRKGKVHSYLERQELGEERRGPRVNRKG
jgi:hypothetical protein